MENKRLAPSGVEEQQVPRQQRPAADQQPIAPVAPGEDCRMNPDELTADNADLQRRFASFALDALRKVTERTRKSQAPGGSQ
jgi:hypothetical protein